MFGPEDEDFCPDLNKLKVGFLLCYFLLLLNTIVTFISSSFILHDIKKLKKGKQILIDVVVLLTIWHVSFFKFIW